VSHVVSLSLILPLKRGWRSPPGVSRASAALGQLFWGPWGGATLIVGATLVAFAGCQVSNISDASRGYFCPPVRGFGRVSPLARGVSPRVVCFTFTGVNRGASRAYRAGGPPGDKRFFPPGFLQGRPTAPEYYPRGPRYDSYQSPWGVLITRLRA